MFKSSHHGGFRRHSRPQQAESVPFVMNRGGNRHTGNRRHGAKNRGNAVADAIDAARFVNKAAPQVAETAFVPAHAFSDFAIAPVILANIVAHGYTTPTPIQDEAIGPILEGKDIIGVANTGTGKTAAFLIPTIDKALRDRSERIMVITPTRELATQILGEFKTLARGTGLEAALLIGGTGMEAQFAALRRTPNFVIGTPGRIKDHIGERSLSLGAFRTIVLDEADRMVDIGFIRDIRYFISLLPQVRQSLFFSATVSGEAGQIVSEFVRPDAETVSVKRRETSKNVDQDVIHVTNKSVKADQLHDLLTRDGFERVLVFVRTKWGVEKLGKFLARKGHAVATIHGNKKQSQRQRALDVFRTGKVGVLIATDVASRGLDIPDVSHVINYDVPATFDDYVHRIGRTGRAERTGIALTFVEQP